MEASREDPAQRGQLSLEGIRTLLMWNDKAVCRALLALYSKQVPQEKANFASFQLNGVGFNASDAPFGSKLARKILAVPEWQLQSAPPLDRHELLNARQRLLKYSRQLMGIALEEELARLRKELL